MSYPGDEGEADKELYYTDDHCKQQLPLEQEVGPLVHYATEHSLQCSELTVQAQGEQHEKETHRP